MTRRRRRDRIFWRTDRGGWYADFRDYADVGGRKEALIPDGARVATTDRDEAARLATARLAAYERHRERGTAGVPTLEVYARRHLQHKARDRRPATLERDARALEHVLAFFGDDALLTDVTVAQLTDYVAHRSRQPGKRAGTLLAAQTIKHELHAVSSLFQRAVAEGLVASNPVRRLPSKPRVQRPEAVWLEIGEAARLMQAADAIAAQSGRANTALGVIVATWLLTGGRRMEVLGLEVDDVDVKARVVHFRPNAWRQLKHAKHRRWIPLWPQLHRRLEAYLEASGRTTGLLFPAQHGGLLTDIRGSLARAVEQAELTKHVTPHTFRHTYAATRMQTTDHGAPVSPYTVMRELGHSSLALIEQTYGHLMQVRHRLPAVEYREAKVLELEERHERA